MINTRPSETEQIPGSTDRTARGVISYYWALRERALEAFSAIASQAGTCKRSLKRHDEHCFRHQNDKMAAARWEQLAILRERIAPGFAEARDKLYRADAEYRQKMFELADIPSRYGRAFITTTFEGGTATRAYTPEAEVRIIASNGTVKILFGELLADGTRAGCWILYANGALHRERTPSDFDDLSPIDRILRNNQ
jgi:hypothetical protein